MAAYRPTSGQDILAVLLLITMIGCAATHAHQQPAARVKRQFVYPAERSQGLQMGAVGNPYSTGALNFGSGIAAPPSMYNNVYPNGNPLQQLPMQSLIQPMLQANGVQQQQQGLYPVSGNNLNLANWQLPGVSYAQNTGPTVFQGQLNPSGYPASVYPLPVNPYLQQQAYLQSPTTSSPMGQQGYGSSRASYQPSGYEVPNLGLTNQADYGYPGASSFGSNRGNTGYGNSIAVGWPTVESSTNRMVEQPYVPSVTTYESGTAQVQTPELVIVQTTEPVTTETTQSSASQTPESVTVVWSTESVNSQTLDSGNTQTSKSGTSEATTRTTSPISQPTTENNPSTTALAAAVTMDSSSTNATVPSTTTTVSQPAVKVTMVHQSTTTTTPIRNPSTITAADFDSKNVVVSVLSQSRRSMKHIARVRPLTQTPSELEAQDITKPTTQTTLETTTVRATNPLTSHSISSLAKTAVTEPTTTLLLDRMSSSQTIATPSIPRSFFPTSTTSTVRSSTGFADGVTMHGSSTSSNELARLLPVPRKSHRRSLSFKY